MRDNLTVACWIACVCFVNGPTRVGRNIKVVVTVSGVATAAGHHLLLPNKHLFRLQTCPLQVPRGQLQRATMEVRFILMCLHELGMTCYA